MAADNKLGVELTGDNAGLMASLAQAEEKIAKLSGKGKEDVSKLGEAFETLSMKHIAGAAIGFGTLAGAAEKALEFISEGIKTVIEIIPKAIEGTVKLAEAFEKVGHHGAHFVNPDAHPDYKPGPSLDAIRRD